MILRSIRVQGWKCFADPVEVGPFGDGLNVLHAPNATGKSTLFEALQRALLDGHRVSGRDAEALRPWGRALAPAVTIEFAHGGVEYRLVKRFLDRPAAELARREGGRFVRMAEGDAADEHVRQMLTSNPPGRGLARRENMGLAQILWAPQGDLAVAALSGDVVTGIRASLGVQVAGPGSGPLEERIEEAYACFFTQGGRLKTGKDAAPLVRLRERLEAEQEKLRAARAQQQAFEEAGRRVEDLRARRAQARRNVEALTKAVVEERARADAYRTMVGERAQRTEQEKAARAEYEKLKQQIEEIARTEKEMADVQEALQRLEADAPLRAREVGEREKAAARAKSDLEDVRKGRQGVEEAEDVARLADRYLRARQDAAVLDERLRRIGEATAAVAAWKKERIVLVAPDDKTLRVIRQAIKARDDAQVRVDAALITLEVVPVVDGSLAVVAGEEVGSFALKGGVPTQVKGSPEVVVDLPGVARVRARGPSGAIADLRAERDRSAHRLKELVGGFGADGIEALEALNGKARELDQQVAEAGARLQTLLGDESPDAIEAARAKSAGLLEEIEGGRPAWREPPPDARELADQAREIRTKFIEAVEAAERKRDAAQAAFTAADKQMAGLSAQLQETDRQVKRLVARLADLTKDGKTPGDRQSERDQLALAWDAARAGLEQAEKVLADFGGDPAAALKKLEGQLQNVEEAAVTALEEEKKAEGDLGRLAAGGTYSVLAETEEEVARLEAEAAGEALRTSAIRLLRDTVAQCRTEAVAAVAGPVEAAATRMLHRMAGGRLGRLRLGECFEPVQVAPELADGPVPIESASGGEREQIYLATRLALAEVLAKDERQLVVLDDVLTATDTGRLARIMAILEEAARHLQVLVLTCHPERYGGLGGASFFDLEAIVRDAAGM